MADYAINNDEKYITCMFKVTPTLKSLCGWPYFLRCIKRSKTSLIFYFILFSLFVTNFQKLRHSPFSMEQSDKNTEW